MNLEHFRGGFTHDDLVVCDARYFFYLFTFVFLLHYPLKLNWSQFLLCFLARIKCEAKMRQLLENNAPFGELAKRIALRFIQTRASLRRIVFIVMCFHLQFVLVLRGKMWSYSCPRGWGLFGHPDGDCISWKSYSHICNEMSDLRKWAQNWG